MTHERFDESETPGYREWDAVELRTLLQIHSFRSRGCGLWYDAAKEVWVMVTNSGLFVGWLDVAWMGPDERLDCLSGVQLLPRGTEESDLGPAVEVMKRARAAASIQCRHCGQVLTPGHIQDRTCHACAAGGWDYDYSE